MSPVSVASVTESETLAPLGVEAMTSRQLVRRAKLVETVIALLNEGNSQTLQMREVAERSGVALGTVYRYFGSKEHLLAVALTEWQEKLTRRVVSADRTQDQESLDAVRSYLRRAARAFHRSPGMAGLMVQIYTSNDPYAAEVVDRMGATNAALMERLLASVPPEDRRFVSFALDSSLTNAITSMTAGRLSLDEVIDALDGVARLLVGPHES